MNKPQIIASLAALCLLGAAHAQNTDPVEIKVETKNEIAAIRPNMYGIFFEDINFGADGGLYAELVKNRSFDFPNHLTGWVAWGDVKIENADPCFERMPNYAVLSLDGNSLTGTGLDNEGFKGIGLKKGESYRIRFYAKVPRGTQTLQFELVDDRNNNPVKAKIEVSGDEWKEYSLPVESTFTCAKSRLRVRLASKGSVLLDHVSMFPARTWKGREGGMREDLAQALCDLHPGVFRFPGGCIVEGTNLETRYQWKNTVGRPENRPLNINRWNYTFPHKLFPDYFQSYGLGFFEYFQLCEDFGADALPVLSCGISCQYELGQLVPCDELQPYIDDALDLIEFANGDPSTPWGKVRAEMGHPEPFGLKMIAIGNEQWDAVYPERLELFVKAIRAEYPEILIVGSSGPSASGDRFDYLWPEMKRLGVDLVDEHYYMSPDWFFANAGRYDDYDRKGPKVFAGEYASHDQPHGKPNHFLAALSEAAFMTGLERNADVVWLATYAPLFAHKDAWQWNPDLIWFDNMTHIVTPNYYVQQLYSLYKGTDALRTSSPQSDLKGGGNLYATSAIDKQKGEIIIKIVNSGKQARPVTLTLDPGKKLRQAYAYAPAARSIVMQSDDLMAENTFENPDAIRPVEGEVAVNGNQVEFTAKGQSFNVIVVKISEK
ncbi:MAG: carbohydrate binding domain-containing protein [Rikenellaceae bacterium]|nr:carbohydrate binding domain-containing protein [Rikenellaceae bacterium]